MTKRNNIMTLLTFMVLAIFFGIATPVTSYAADVYVYDINGSIRTLTLDSIDKKVLLEVDGVEYTIIDGEPFFDAALDLDGTVWVHKNNQLYWWNYDLEHNKTKISLHKVSLEHYHDNVASMRFDSEFIFVLGFNNSNYVKYNLISYEQQEKFLTDLANGTATEDDAPIAVKTDSNNSSIFKSYTFEDNSFTLDFDYSNVTLSERSIHKLYYILKNDNYTYTSFDKIGTLWIWKNGDLYWWNYQLQHDEKEINLHKLQLPNGVTIVDLIFDSKDDLIIGYTRSDGNSFSVLTLDEQESIINSSVSGNGSGTSDSGNTDSGNTDSGNTDSGNTDSGNTDSGNTDSGNTDSGNTGSNDSQSGGSQLEDKPAPEKPVVDTPKVKKGDTFTKSNIKYKVLSANTVAVSKATASIKKATIPATVKNNGITFKVVSVEANAFKDCKKLTNVTIGKNVKTIKSKAFYNCKSLKKITVKSTVLTSCGKNALKGINKKAVITVPKSKLKAYKKLFKNKGQGKQVTIK